MLKDSVCTSCEVDELTAEEERFFYRLIVQCDDFGRIDARPPILRARCFPLKVDKVKDSDIKQWLKKLEDVGLIVIYYVNDKPYLQFSTWEKHQQKRAKHSKYPAPDGNLQSHDNSCDQVITNVPEKRETRNEKRESDQGCSEYTSEFETFWNIYPRKKEKKAAFGKWKATKNKGADPKDLIKAATNYSQECKAECTSDKYIKLARTFLGPDEHWKEYLTTTAKKPGSHIKLKPGQLPGETDAEYIKRKRAGAN